MIKDTTKVIGDVRLVLTDANGNLKDKREIHNLVVDTGNNLLASRLASASSPVIGWIALGTGTNAPAHGDTTLQTELVRLATTVSGGTVTNNSILFQQTFGAGTGTGALTEAGLFNAVSAGVMAARTTFSVINKGSGDILTVYWTLTIG